MESKCVLMAFNDGFLLPAIVSIYSLFEKNNNIDLFVMYIELSDKSKTIVKKLERSGENNRIFFIAVDESYISRIKISTGRWRYETFFRYFSPDIFPTKDRVLWLDSDILVRGSIDELYYCDIEEHSFAAAVDNSSDPVNRLGLNNYVNAGILLINNKRLREKQEMNRYWALIANEDYKGELPDQDALNIVFEDDIKRISNIWNIAPFFEDENLDYYICNSVIIHYMSSHKPWKVDEVEYFGNLFDDYPSAGVFIPEYWDCMEKAIMAIE